MLSVVKAKTLSDTLAEVATNRCSCWLAEKKGKQLLHGLDDTLAQVEPETLSYTLVEMKAELLVDALVDLLAEVKTLSGKLAKVD